MTESEGAETGRLKAGEKERERVTERKRVGKEKGGDGGEGLLGPLAANCSRQANRKQDMSEYRACIYIAFKKLKAGIEQGAPQLHL